MNTSKLALAKNINYARINRKMAINIKKDARSAKYYINQDIEKLKGDIDTNNKERIMLIKESEKMNEEVNEKIIVVKKLSVLNDELIEKKKELVTMLVTLNKKIEGKQSELERMIFKENKIKSN